VPCRLLQGQPKVYTGVGLVSLEHEVHCVEKKQQIILGILAFFGLVILIGDILGDLHFFADATRRTTGLMASAVLRNLLTLCAVVALFMNRKWAAFLLIIVALLGLWRRVSFLLPLKVLGVGPSFLLVHSGADLVFRGMILGVGIGYLLGREAEKS